MDFQSDSVYYLFWYSKTFYVVDEYWFKSTTLEQEEYHAQEITNEEVEIRQNNPYTYTVTPSFTFTKEYKEILERILGRRNPPSNP